MAEQTPLDAFRAVLAPTMKERGLLFADQYRRMFDGDLPESVVGVVG